MNVRKTSTSKTRSAPGPAGKIQDLPPLGISPVLRGSWKFARHTAERFNRELLEDRLKDLLKKLAKRFV